MSKSKPMTLTEVLDACRATWGGKTGEERAMKVGTLIEQTCHHYGEQLDMDPDEIFRIIEGQRDYCPVNYYQPAKFPPLTDVLLYDDEADFYAMADGKGFRCPSCGGSSDDPQTCSEHPCDWKAYGLLGTLGKGVKILFRSKLETNLVPVAIFKPIALEKADVPEREVDV